MRRRTPALVLSAALLVLPLALASPAPAAADCDTPIIDTAGALAGDGALQNAVDAATRAGVVIRVRAYESVPNADLDAHIADIQASCPSWKGASGSRRSNLLALAVSVSDRTTGLYYGSAFDGPLDGQWSRIQTDLMNPYFRDGDFDAGLAAGTNEAVRLIQAWQRPAAPAPRDVTPPPVPALASEPSAGSRFGGFVAVLGGLLVLVALGIGAILGFPAWRRRRDRDRARAAAHARAQAAHDVAAAAFLALDAQSRDVESAVEAVTSATSTEDDAPMRAALRAARAAVDEASGRWVAAEESWSPGHLATLTRGQSDSAERRFTSIAKELNAAGALMSSLDAQVQEAAHDFDTLPAELDRVRDLVDVADADIDASRTAGFDVTSLIARMAPAGQSLDEVAALLAENRVGAARHLLARVEADARSASALATTLSSRIADCARALAAVDADRAARKAAYPAAAVALAALIEQYGPASLAGVDAAIADIPAALAVAATALSAGNTALALRSPEGLARGQAELDRATGALAGVAAANRQLTERRAVLAELAATLPTRLATVDAAIAQVRAYVSAHEGDVDPSRTGDLDAAAASSEAIAISLHRSKPDLPILANRLSDLETATTSASSAAQSDVRTATEARSEARAALAEAKSALDLSESALAHYGESGSGRADLTQARRIYEKALASDDAALVVSLSAEASRQADRARRAARATTEAGLADRTSDANETDAAERASGGGGGGGSSGFGSGEGGGGSSKW